MSTTRKILMLSSEAVPFAKAGGLGDVVPILAKELARQGHDVRILIPRYYFIDRSVLKEIPLQLKVDNEGADELVQIYATTVGQSSAIIYFLDFEQYYGRDGIYGSKIEPDFHDNPERFAFLNKAAFGLCRKLDWIPDVIHAHDWPCAPSLGILETTEKYGAFEKTAGVFTIHNVGYQGLFPAERYPALGIPSSDFRPGSFEFFGRLNFMQGALRHADKITTVSPTYAAEIMSPRLGFGMEGILRERAADLVGILNGMDYDEWDPSRDTHLNFHFDWENLSGKVQNKRELQQACGFDPDPSIPVFGLISRLVSQKGFVELAAPGSGSLKRILSDFPGQVVILGTGEKWCEEELLRISRVHPRLKVFLSYSDQLSHLIQAGSDFFLMPSLYEPCGLTQMYALRYGTIPVVAPTGGLADSVTDLKTFPAKATGIYVPMPVQPESIYQAVTSAHNLWLDRRSTLVEMQVRGMKQRFSWEKSGKMYSQVYEDAIAKKRSR